MTLTAIGVGHRTRKGSRARTKSFPMEMGWNLVDPPIELPPGAIIEGANYEVHFRRGYQRCSGYERFDGTGRPSVEPYVLVPYDNGDTAPAVDDVVTGATSGATGTVLATKAPTTGSFAGSDAAGFMVLWGVTGTFQDNENLEISAAVVATVDGTQEENSEPDDDLHNTYRQAAIEARRDSIGKVPGSGAVRGVWRYKGNYYAFRDNAGGTACVMHKATSSGWVAQDLGHTMNFDMDAVEVPFDSGSDEPSVGDIITVASGGSGTFRGVTLDSGTWGGGNAAGTMVLVAHSGSFADNDQIDNTTTSATNIATQDGDALVGHELFEGETLTGGFSGATATVGRLVIQSGSFAADSAEGYMVLSGVTGTFQDDEPLHGSDVRVPFDSGSIEPSVGDTITGATSGASGEVRELLPLDSGSWDDGDATGTLVLKDATGTFNGTEDLNNTTTSANNIATQSGDESHFTVLANGINAATTLNPGGRYEFVNHNFGGHEESRRMYGADGKNNAFEWDGSVYAPIRTGMVDDTPEFILAHKQHLFLAFRGGSLQHSSTGVPLVWSPITGAAELAVGENITGLSIEVGNVMAVFARSETYMLYGTNSSNWDLRRFHQGSGAIKFTVQKMVVTWMLDDNGMVALNATEAYGDFAQATMTSHIQPYINTVVGPDRVRGPQGSIRVRKKNQYRVYFNDKTGLNITMEANSVKGVMRFELDHQFNCMYSVKDDEESLGDESEELMAGGDDGYVYLLDSGTSFDGEEVRAWFLLSYHHYGSPQINKIFRGAVLEMDVESVGEINVIPDFSYGSDHYPTALQATIEMLGAGGRWDVDNWNEFFWSAPIFQQGRLRPLGHGKNMGLLVVSESTYEYPHIIQGVTVEFAPRRLVR